MVEIDENKYPRLAKRLSRPVPEGKVAQLHEFATDLAVGYDEGAWKPRILPARGGTSIGSTVKVPPSLWTIGSNRNNSNPVEAMRSKWSEKNHPDFQAMVSLGYFILGKSRVYHLTDKAIRLADAPATSQQVFISYKRIESSAFALLLEKSIRYETNATPFLDMSIDPGEEWHEKLEEKVRDSDVFVAMLAPESLDSPYVRKEIGWALSNDKTDLIVPVWHAGYEGKRADDPLNGHQAVVVDQESAKHYRAAADEVMNRLGYSVALLEQRRAGAGVQE